MKLKDNQIVYRVKPPPNADLRKIAVQALEVLARNGIKPTISNVEGVFSSAEEYLLDLLGHDKCADTVHVMPVSGTRDPVHDYVALDRIGLRRCYLCER